MKTQKKKVMSTDFKNVDEATGLCQIKQSFNQRITMLYDNERNKWMSDLATLAIEYGGQEIGQCTFDLVKYLDKGAHTEKAIMQVEGDSSSTSQLRLVGDSASQPDAHLLFRIYVDTINNDDEVNEDNE